ncbi:unnamed protein product, partial [Allacma fusca]
MSNVSTPEGFQMSPQTRMEQSALCFMFKDLNSSNVFEDGHDEAYGVNTPLKVEGSLKDSSLDIFCSVGTNSSSDFGRATKKVADTVQSKCHCWMLDC